MLHAFSMFSSSTLYDALVQWLHVDGNIWQWV